MNAAVSLYTREGDFVAELQPPKTSEPPDVIVWGTRTFVRRKYSDPRLAASYYEAFAWVAPTEATR